MNNLYIAYREIVNYLIVRRTIFKASRGAAWRKHNLRSDWVGRIYTVINPRPADKGDDDFVLQAKAVERAMPTNRYIESIGISDIVFASMERIPDSESYLLVYSPIFNVITFPKIFWTTVIALILGLMGFYSWTSHLISKSFHIISSWIGQLS